MNSPKATISVFAYTDYRKFLEDYYKYQKKTNRSFSYRYFSRKASLNSIGLYKDVVSGKRGLGRAMIVKFSEAIGLKKKAAEYFENMVLFNEAHSIEEKKMYFKRMLTSYQSKAFKIDAKRYEFFSKWYYAALREVLALEPGVKDPGALANSLNPPITAAQAKKALRLLENLKYIRKEKNGTYKRINPVLTTGDEVRSLNVANFQNSMIKLAMEATRRHKKEHRDMSTLTLSIDKEAFAAIKSEIIDFRKKILTIANRVSNPDRVYQANFQYFPLSKFKD